MGWVSGRYALYIAHLIRHLRIRLERVLFFVVRIYPQDFDPLLIVEIALPIGKWAFEEFIDLQANFSPAGIESGTREHL